MWCAPLVVLLCCVAVAVAMCAAVEDELDLESQLLALIGEGAGSVRRMARLCESIERGCTGVSSHVHEIAKIAKGSNKERALHRWVGQQPWRELLPPMYTFDLDLQNDEENVVTVKHGAYLPYEVFARLGRYPELFEDLLSGPPGAMDEFWNHSQNTHWYQNHPEPSNPKP